jgi:transcriptional regulator with XRE-family HTH domain
MSNVVATDAGLALLKEALAQTKRNENGKFNQLDLAEKAYVSERTVRRFLKRTDPISETYARSICQALNVNFDDVVEVDRLKSGDHPFKYGDPVSGDQFYGREKALKFIGDRLKQGTSVNLIGLRRSGKTSLLKYLMENWFQSICSTPEKTIMVFMDLSTPLYATPLDLTEGLRRGIEKKMPRTKSPWKKDENGDVWSVQDGLEDVKEQGFQVVVVMDEFEAIGQKLEQFQDWGNDWRSKASTDGLFTMVVASQRSIPEFYKTHQKTSPFENIFNLFVLGAMEPEEWQELVQDGFGQQNTPAIVSRIDDLSGGLPYYVQLAASALWESNGDGKLARVLFDREAGERFRILWGDLEEKERATLLSGEGVSLRLKDYGLVRSNGRLFSSAFGDWIKENGGAI